MEIKSTSESLQKRRAMFIFGCITARLWLTYVVMNNTRLDKEWLLLLAGILVMIGVGFWWIYWFDLRKTGLEVFGDVIWWNNLRPLHGTLFLLAGLLLFTKSYKGYAWKLLLGDTIIGLVMFAQHHKLRF